MFKRGDKVLFNTGLMRYLQTGTVTKTRYDKAWKEQAVCVEWQFTDGCLASVSWVRQSHLCAYRKATQTRRWNELERLCNR